MKSPEDITAAMLPALTQVDQECAAHLAELEASVTKLKELGVSTAALRPLEASIEASKRAQDKAYADAIAAALKPLGIMLRALPPRRRRAPKRQAPALEETRSEAPSPLRVVGEEGQDVEGIPF